MPLQTFNFPGFGNVESQDLSQNLFQNILEGYQMGQIPEQARRAREVENLGLADARIKNKYAEEREKASLDLIKAKMAHENRLASERGVGGMSYGERTGLTPALRIWNSLPSDAKSDLLATAAGMDFPIDFAANFFANGGTLEELAAMKKQTLQDVQKSFSPTKANITAQKNQEGGAAELDYLENKISTAIAPYSRNIAGFSPLQIVDAISGANEDEQAQFLAARALQPELAGARTRIAGGSNAHEALKDAQDKALGNYRIFESLVSPSVYSKTQHYINEWLKEGNVARRNAVFNIKSNSGSGMIKGKINGRSVTIPADKKDAFIKDGGVVNE